MSEIASVSSAVSASTGLAGAGSNGAASGAPAGDVSSGSSGDINSISSQIITSSSQFSRTSVMAGSYYSSSIAVSEFGDKMIAAILALLDFLFGNKDDDEKKQIGLMALMALFGSSQAQSSSRVQYSQYFATSYSSVSDMQMVQTLAAGSAYGQSGSAYGGGEMGSEAGGSIDTSA